MLIQLENVTFGYDDKPILENVSLTLSEGERAGFIGPNGEGKTTLIRLLSGALAPDAGRVLKKSGLKIGLLEQTGGLESGKTVYEEMRGVFAPVLGWAADAWGGLSPAMHLLTPLAFIGAVCAFFLKKPQNAD